MANIIFFFVNLNLLAAQCPQSTAPPPLTHAYYFITPKKTNMFNCCENNITREFLQKE